MVLVFGECELDLARGELRRRGELRHVEPQVFAVLAYLIEHRERLVSPAELLDHVWQRRFVTPATLNSRVKTARQAIGDDGREQQFIRTLRGRGFRFIAPVQVRDGTPPVAEIPAVIDTPEPIALPTLANALRGRYVIDHVLGRGGMATVYLARDLRHERPVALKVLRPDTAGALGAPRFHREIRLSAGLQHPNILPVFDSGAADGILWYSMPHVAGASLRQRLDSTGRLPIAEALTLAREVADALAYAHANGVVHRDIKPENILLSETHALVADFGVARMLEPEAEARDANLTVAGTTVGSPAYMSPEQIAGEPVDGRADIYALGCVLFEMLAGQPPLTGSVAQVMSRRLTESAPRVRALRPEIPAGVATALQRALARRADDRFASISEFADGLSGASSARRTTSGSGTPRRPLRTVAGDTAPSGTGVVDVSRERVASATRTTRAAVYDATGGLDAAGALERARAAYAGAAWREAYDELVALDAEHMLGAEDLERLGEAAWWLMDSRTSVRARERAYREFVRHSDGAAAGRVALALAEDHFHRLARSVAQGWFRRAERHLGGVDDVLEAGWLHRMRAVMALGERRFDDALADADRALAIARRVGDADLDALALQDRGRILVALGRVGEGMALIDEAMAAVAGGELTPHTTGRAYCNMISVCERLSDFGRAAEWQDVAEHWGDPYADSAFPGICRVFRAGILRIRGALPEAEREARRACEELEDFLEDIAGEAFNELGEIRLRAGDLPGAGTMFAEAHARGREPQPGLALLRLAEGSPDAARSMIERALAEPALSPLDRSKLLPAYVEIMIACEALDAAEAAATELQTITETYTAPALVASAAVARGALALARGNADEAVLHLRRARKTWTEVDMPFELASTRLLLARAFTTLGHLDEAGLEERAARATLERIGAKSITAPT
ncbi:MAG TPA: protein kinase [Gemmatimonadaceae bacterium]|nr:protein kinase [Gemmatimonadaceae bacterium]